MANAKKEVIATEVVIDTDNFVIPNDFQEEALKIFDERYGKRNPEQVRITGMQHSVGTSVTYFIEAKMDVDSGPAPVPGAVTADDSGETKAK